MLYYLTLNVLHSLGNRKTFGTQNIVVDGVLNWLYLTLLGSSPNASDTIAAMAKTPQSLPHSTTTAVTKHCFHK